MAGYIVSDRRNPRDEYDYGQNGRDNAANPGSDESPAVFRIHASCIYGSDRGIGFDDRIWAKDNTAA